MRKLAAGNWKMNGTSATLAELEALSKAHPDPGVDVLVCLPATLIHPARTLLDNAPVALGGQDCHAAASGAHTGDIAAAQLADAGASAVILGHSERREDHGETSDRVRQKAIAAHQAGLIAVICLGETLAQREAGETLAIIGAQLSASLPDTCTAANTVVAYEPVWAIGTGKIPTKAQIADVHSFVREGLIAELGAQEAAGLRLLYGGSVKPANAAEIFGIENVDGALVGGASLTAAEFSPIIRALEASVHPA